MKYPIETKTIVDITKPPYCADNTGRVDCTEIVRRALDDILIREIEAMQTLHDKLVRESNNCTENVYFGLEAGRVQNGKLWITFPDDLPPTRILYFPKGTYLVSDTVTYTHENLKNFWYTLEYYEANRNIHLMGESREETVIRLADNTPGYGHGADKAVVSVVNNQAPVPRNQEYANNAFMNFITDLTVDCGRGNPGAVGIHFISSNVGRISNVTVRAEEGMYGITTDFATQCVMSDLKIEGFDYGLDVAYSIMMVLRDLDLSGNRKAGILSTKAQLVTDGIVTGSIAAIELADFDGDADESNPEFAIFGNSLSRCLLTDAGAKVVGERGRYDYVLYDTSEESARRRRIPKNNASYDREDVAFVDDYGAIGDGVTDSTRAIQKAMQSGKPTVLFGEGQYLINGKIKIPASVKNVDFLFCSLATGIRLVGGEFDAAFEISEDSSEPLFMHSLFCWEQFRGHIRLVKHAAKRDAVFYDIQLMTASMYFNSVEGSRVWFENVFLTTGTYTLTAWIPGDGFEPVYSHILPYEFHGQTVYGTQVNPERADAAMLVDGGDIFLEGYRTEGPGTALKTTGDAKVKIQVFNAGIGAKRVEHALFEQEGGTLDLKLAFAFGFDKESEYNHLVRDRRRGEEKILEWSDAEPCGAHGALIVDYHD